MRVNSAKPTKFGRMKLQPIRMLRRRILRLAVFREAPPRGVRGVAASGRSVMVVMVSFGS
ncbi:hypothetical protein GCM10027415_27200 [Humibacter ginsengisoli]